jgi:hypothetical protein
LETKKKQETQFLKDGWRKRRRLLQESTEENQWDFLAPLPEQWL